jgi:hypothetical protein
LITAPGGELQTHPLTPIFAGNPENERQEAYALHYS